MWGFIYFYSFYLKVWTVSRLRFLWTTGWEYGITIPPDDKPKSWVAAEKMYHVHRRMRLVRPRKKISDQTAVVEVRNEKIWNQDFSETYSGWFLQWFLQRREAGEGWEYSSLIGWKFHRKERSSDTFRRRRWRRKMVPSDHMGSSAIFKLEGALVSVMESSAG